MLRIAIWGGDGLFCQKIGEELTRGLREAGEKAALFFCPDESFLLAEQEKAPFICAFLELSTACSETALELAETLQEGGGPTRVVFLSGQPELVFTALRIPFLHFIRKDCLEQDLTVALEKLRRELVKHPEFGLFHSGGGLERIPLADVLYMESFRHTITVHCRERSFPASDTLAELSGMLHDSGFLRIHKSFLVNLFHVASIRGFSIILEDGTELPMSRRKSMEIRQRFETYIRRLEWLRE